MPTPITTDDVTLPEARGATAAIARRRLAIPLVAAALITMADRPAEAHPHVFTEVRTEVVYSDKRIVGLRNRWRFDEGYSAMAVADLDINKDGKYDREELAELAKVNIEGLSEFDYFTLARLGETQLALGAPRDYHLEHEAVSQPGSEPQHILTLEFFLPLAEPVLADAEGFAFEIYDPTFYIAFAFAETDAIRLGGEAPPGCAASIGTAPGDSEEAARLGDSFMQQFGSNLGLMMSRTVSVTCPKPGAPKAG
ncbi:MAG: DUF1007 family protein [Hyphomicrobiaceae bacterium]|nr:DUF1007 family protein [Hyphomicrobiaceae bacterium]